MPDFRLPPLNLGERFYRVLLRLYPPRFRRAFAQDLVEAFRDQRRDAGRTHGDAALFWPAMLQDVVTTAFGEWMATFWRARRGIEDSTTGATPMTMLTMALHPSELRFALRRLRRAPGFVCAVVLVLAIGIGATTAAFSLVNGVLLAPLPFPSPERLVRLTNSVEITGHEVLDQSDAMVMLYQTHARAFDGIGAWRVADANLVVANGNQEPERINVARTTANLFDVLRVRPAHGRSFTAGEDREGATRVAIISHALWQRRFHGDPAALGQQVTVNGVARTIVGVMPASFNFPSTDIELWMPFAFDPAHAQPASFNYLGVGRLRDGVSSEEARSDLARVLPRLLEEYPSNIPPKMWEEAHVAPRLESLRDSIVGGVSRLLWVLLASIALVLVIACANVASLFLVRAESRQLELAVRGALGSGVAGLVAQSLSETLLLASVGGVLGVLLAAAGVRLTVQAGDTLALPRLNEVSVDARVLVFAAVTALFAALFVSLLPMLRARRVSIAAVLRGGGRGTTAGGARQRARSALVVAQTALALVLVASSGLLARSFLRLQQVEPGFDADRVVMARVILPFAVYTTPAMRSNFFDALQEQVLGIPGVRDAGITDWVPLSKDHNDSALEVEDHPLAPNAVPPSHDVASVSGGYFRTMSISLLRGRTFGPQDAARPKAEAIVSHALAMRYWHGESPIGKRIRHFGGAWLTVIGEVGDAHYEALDKPLDEIVYLPLVTPVGSASNTPCCAALVVRSALPSASLLSSIRGVVHSLDPSLPTFDERTVSSLVRAASARARAMLFLLATASVIALVLGAVGLYGVMAYSVGLRRREIGVRIALGARPADVSRMVSLDGLRLAVAGVTIGIVCAIGVTRFLRSLLYDVSPTDPLTLGVTAVVLLAIALVASWLPARRAASVDPSEALRA